MRGYQTVEEWEARLGEQLRDVRVARALDQVGLAELANVSVRAVSNLERGRGSSLRTLVAVAKALERTDWLDALAPPVTISPIQMLRAKTRTQGRRVRVRTGRSEV